MDRRTISQIRIKDVRLVKDKIDMYDYFRKFKYDDISFQASKLNDLVQIMLYEIQENLFI